MIIHFNQDPAIESGGGGGGTNDGGGAGGSSETSFFEGLSDDLKANDFVKGFEGKDVSDFVNAAIDLHGKVPEIPEDRDGYNLEKYPEMQNLIDPKEFELLKTFAKEQGWTNAQFAEAVKFDVARVDRAWQAAEKAKEVAAQELKTDWGADYETNLDRCKLVMKSFSDIAGEGVVSSLKEDPLMGFGNNPNALRLLYAFSKAISEDWLTRGGGDIPKSGIEKTAAEVLYPSN